MLRTASLTTLFLVVTILFTGCLKNSIHSVPPSARILFLSNMGTKNRLKEIYTMSYFHHTIIGIDRTGRYIVATCVEKGTNFPEGPGDEDRKSVWIIKTKRRLTDPKNSAEGDSFSPDSQWIVFQMIVSGEKQTDIYKIKRDGTGLTRLTQTYDTVESDPCWSPDGKKIAFGSYSPETKRFILKIMDQNGGNIKVVHDPKDAVSTPHFKPGVYDPSWSPDGN